MGYYIRVLAENAAVVLAEELRAGFRRDGLKVDLEVTDGSDSFWAELELRHADGTPIAAIEKNLVRPGELGADEIAEFIEEVADLQPRSAARWLENYLPTVRVIYSFQLLSGTDVGDGWKAVHAIRGRLWNRLGGIPSG